MPRLPKRPILFSRREYLGEILWPTPARIAGNRFKGRAIGQECQRGRLVGSFSGEKRTKFCQQCKPDRQDSPEYCKHSPEHCGQGTAIGQACQHGRLVGSFSGEKRTVKRDDSTEFCQQCKRHGGIGNRAS